MSNPLIEVIFSADGIGKYSYVMSEKEDDVTIRYQEEHDFYFYVTLHKNGMICVECIHREHGPGRSYALNPRQLYDILAQLADHLDVQLGLVSM